MRSLQEIVADNRKAAQQGHVEPGAAVGTAGYVAIRYNVFNAKGERIATDITLAEAAQYRTGINDGSYRLEQISGPPPRSAGQRGSLTSGKVDQGKSKTTNG